MSVSEYPPDHGSLNGLDGDDHTQYALYDSGTYAGRPADGRNGRIYRSTNTDEVFLDTGTAWRPLWVPERRRRSTFGSTGTTISGTNNYHLVTYTFSKPTDWPNYIVQASAYVPVGLSPNAGVKHNLRVHDGSTFYYIWSMETNTVHARNADNCGGALSVGPFTDTSRTFILNYEIIGAGSTTYFAGYFDLVFKPGIAI